MRRLPVVLLTAGLSTIFASCSTGGTPPQPPPSSSPSVTVPATASPSAPNEATDFAVIRGQLRNAGLRTGSWTRGTASEAFFAEGPRRPWRLPVEDGTILAYPFVNLASAERAVAAINPEDPFPTIDFKGAPHVFRSGPIVLLFVQNGTYQSPSPADERILSVLRSRFGTDYASRW